MVCHTATAPVDTTIEWDRKQVGYENVGRTESLLFQPSGGLPQSQRTVSHLGKIEDGV